MTPDDAAFLIEREEMNMKKIIVTLLALMLLTVFTVAAGAPSGIDLTAYTLDELIEIRNAVIDEIDTRLEIDSSDEMYQGQYTVGTHIKAGTYLFTSTADYFSFHLYTDETQDDLICNTSLALGEQYYVELTDGMLLYVYNGKGTVTPWAKPSWAM